MQLLGAKFTPTPVGGQVQAEVEVAATLAADGSGQVHGQGANDGVAALDVCGVQVTGVLVDAQALLRSPRNGTGVAADEPSGHGFRLPHAVRRA